MPGKVGSQPLRLKLGGLRRAIDCTAKLAYYRKNRLISLQKSSLIIESSWNNETLG